MQENKYIYARRLIYETIYKDVQAGNSPKDIAEDMFGRYRLEVTLHDVPKEMVLRMYQLLAEQCYYDIYKKHYEGE